MFNKSLFGMSVKDLVENSMNPKINSNSSLGGTSLGIYNEIGSTYKAYNPYEELDEPDNEAKVLRFDAKRPETTPSFSMDATSQMLIDMNARETEQTFRKQEQLKQDISNLFNVTRGDTPGERAKSEQISTLLAEIDGFASQYNLNDKQKETLKTSMLSNHLGDYIRTKNALTLNDEEKRKADAMALATGNYTPSNAPIVKDAVNGLDENGIRHGIEESKTGDPGAGGGSFAGVAGGAGGAGGDGGDGGGNQEVVNATSKLDVNEIPEYIKTLKRRLLDEAGRKKPENELTIRAIMEWGIRTWGKVFRLYSEGTEKKKEIEYIEINSSNVVMNYLNSILGFGTKVGDVEKDILLSIFNNLKTQFNGMKLK